MRKQYRNRKRTIKDHILLIRFVIVLSIQVLKKPIGTKFEVKNKQVNRFVYIYKMINLMKTF